MLPFQNPDLPPAKRAADLVSRMSLEEKVSQMQNTAPAIAHLGIPAYDWWNEGLHGVARAGLATVFPQAIGLAATWDTDLMHNVADTISTEARAKYNDAIQRDNHRRYFGLTFWSPNINIFRDPRWGRGQETYGEDPYLTSRMAVAFITGMQGNDPHYYKTIATAKHFAVHSGPEPGRHSFDVIPSKRDFNDTYLPAFRASIEEAKADSVMCAYNSVDGVPACANDVLLKDTLRGAWNFQGYVVSDCGAIGDIFHGHKYKSSMPAASAAAVQAGTDLSCGKEYASLAQAVHGGLIAESEIDRSVERLFEARIRLGMFDPPARVPFSAIPYSEVNSAAHRQLAVEAARKSMVLLKNTNGILPLGSSVHRIAVMGPGANDPEALLGNYNGIPSRIVTPLEGIEEEFLGKAEVNFVQGATYTAQSPALIPSGALTPAGENSGHGLLAEYFDNADLTGTPKVSRVEPHIYFRPEMRGPALAAATPVEHFSVRWTGTLRVPATGDYAIGTTRLHCEDCRGTTSARVFLDDHPVEEAPVHFEKDRGYRLRVEYREQGNAGGIELTWMPPADAMLQEAAEAAKTSDVTIAFVGLNSHLEGEEMRNTIPGFLGGDRTDIELPATQRELLRTIFEAGKPVVVVLINGSALAVNSAEEHAAAILDAWYGGEAAGTAIAETLAGKNNPAGRLPVTFYRSVDQLPPFDNYSMDGRTYRYFRGEPLYPFGHGLSYSTFHYSDLQARRDGGKVQVSVRVTNTSQRDGDEVVQLYVSRQREPDAAIRDLRAFRRIHLAAGDSRDLQFAIPAASGKVRISVGGGQPLAKWTSGRYIETTE
ncbi:MAG: glycoside hydrolase family 3 C-terminal domain-containing protein [Bryobacteraceae bacterium]